MTATDAWGLLAGWRARRQFAWPAGAATVFELLAVVLGRAGLRLVSLNGSAALGSLQPAFAIHPGVDGRTAARALLAMVPDALRFDGAEAVASELSAEEPPSYEYGPAHPWLRLSPGGVVPAANRALITGNGVSAETFDWTSVEASYDRLVHVEDRNAGDEAAAAARAATALRRLALARDAGEATVRPNVGQELYDVVRFADAGVDVVRRVRGLSLRFRRRGRPLFELTLRLGPV